MDRIRRRATGLAVVALLGLGACSSNEIRPEVLQRWVGRPAAALEKDWGPATRELTDNGLRLLVYDQLEGVEGVKTTSGGVQSRTIQSAVNAQAQATAFPIQHYARSYLFWVDTTGTIVRTETRGGQ